MNDITNAKENTAPKEKRKAVLSLENLDIRDYFAAKAMQGLIASPRGTPNGKDATTDYYAKMAYLMADAMIAEREKEDGQ